MTKMSGAGRRAYVLNQYKKAQQRREHELLQAGKAYMDAARVKPVTTKEIADLLNIPEADVVKGWEIADRLKSDDHATSP